MQRIAVLLNVWMYWAIIFESCSGLDLDKITSKVELKNCTRNADCGSNECCTFEAEATLTTSTKIAWRCKSLGDVDEICHSLGSVHCPCRPGLRCVPKAIWFFGAGLCKQKN